MCQALFLLKYQCLARFDPIWSDLNRFDPIMTRFEPIFGAIMLLSRTRGTVISILT